MLWARSATPAWNAHGWLLSKRDGLLPKGYILHPLLNQRGLGFYVGGGDRWYAASSPGPSDITVWHHYAGTFDGSAVRLYIDGVEAAATAFAGPADHGQGEDVIHIGADLAESQNRYGQGAIDEVRIFGQALSQGEIADIGRHPYEAAPPGAPQAVVGSPGPAPRDALVAWAPPPGPPPEAYRIYRAEGSGPLQLVEALPATESTFVDHGLEAGPYEYLVRAWNAAGESDNDVTVTVPGTGWLLDL
jgi:hypothetical protein